MARERCECTLDVDAYVATFNVVASHGSVGDPLGLGFFEPPHGQAGASGKAIELHRCHSR